MTNCGPFLNRRRSRALGLRGDGALILVRERRNFVLWHIGSRWSFGFSYMIPLRPWGWDYLLAFLSKGR